MDDEEASRQLDSPLIFPRSRLASGLGAGIGPLSSAINCLAERLPRLLRASPSTALDEFHCFANASQQEGLYQRTTDCQRLDVVHLRPTLGLGAYLFKRHIISRLFGGLLDPPPRAFDFLRTARFRKQWHFQH